VELFFPLSTVFEAKTLIIGGETAWRWKIFHRQVKKKVILAVEQKRWKFFGACEVTFNERLMCAATLMCRPNQGRPF
jgi:hypothetical protein